MLEHGYMLARASRSRAVAGCELARTPPLRAAAWAHRVALRLDVTVESIESGDAVEAGEGMHQHFTQHREVDERA